MLSMPACMASPAVAREIDSMAWRKAFRDPRFRPYTLGVLIGLPLAAVIWALLTHRHPLGVVCLAAWVVLCSFWFRSAIFKTLLVACFVGTFLAVIFWKP